MSDRTITAPRHIFEAMLERIRGGAWKVGQAIPGERVLIDEFGVSRLALREALSMLRGLGLIETAQGRGSVVQAIDSRLLGQLMPLMISLEGEHTYEQIYEVRLTVEPRHAYLAALRRSPSDLARLEELHAALVASAGEALGRWVRADMDFHQAIAAATRNPLLPVMLRMMTEYVIHAQKVSCAGDRAKRGRTLQAHENILHAVRQRDGERARVEMEAHLRSSFERTAPKNTFGGG
jgi:GntR family transcriptional regulator, transcriptional repressor for pyruvate dehydrogenase complex